MMSDASKSPLFGADGKEFRRRLSILRDLDFEAAALTTARRLAMESLLEFIDANDMLRATYLDDMVLQYCELS